GAGRPEGVATLSPEPLPIAHLKITRTHIIKDGIAGDVLEDFLFRYAFPTLSHDRCKFRLVVHLSRVGREEDGIARAADGVAGLQEEHRPRGRFEALFGSVGFIVESHANNLPRP